MSREYDDCAWIVNELISKRSSSLKTLIYSKKFKNKPKVYAIVSETLKRVKLFKEAFEECGLNLESFAKNQGLLFVN